jgi:hypothetical protein
MIEYLMSFVVVLKEKILDSAAVEADYIHMQKCVYLTCMSYNMISNHDRRSAQYGGSAEAGTDNRLHMPHRKPSG